MLWPAKGPFVHFGADNRTEEDHVNFQLNIIQRRTICIAVLRLILKCRNQEHHIYEDIPTSVLHVSVKTGLSMFRALPKGPLHYVKIS